jgi:hypothetical protein
MSLSIYVLELMRAEREIVGLVFDYTEEMSSRSFSVILDALFESIFVVEFNLKIIISRSSILLLIQNQLP